MHADFAALQAAGKPPPSSPPPAPAVPTRCDAISGRFARAASIHADSGASVASGGGSQRRQFPIRRPTAAARAAGPESDAARSRCSSKSERSSVACINCASSVSTSSRVPSPASSRFCAISRSCCRRCRRRSALSISASTDRADAYASCTSRDHIQHRHQRRRRRFAQAMVRRRDLRRLLQQRQQIGGQRRLKGGVRAALQREAKIERQNRIGQQPRLIRIGLRHPHLREARLNPRIMRQRQANRLLRRQRPVGSRMAPIGSGSSRKTIAFSIPVSRAASAGTSGRRAWQPAQPRQQQQCQCQSRAVDAPIETSEASRDMASRCLLQSQAICARSINEAKCQHVPTHAGTARNLWLLPSSNPYTSTLKLLASVRDLALAR